MPYIVSISEDDEAVYIRFKHDDLQGDDLIAFTDQQFKRLAKAYCQGKMSKKQVENYTIVEDDEFLDSIMNEVHGTFST